MRGDIASLVEQLEKAATGSRQLDGDICQTLGGKLWGRRSTLTGRHQWMTEVDGLPKLLPAFTTSLDAALSLKERELPGMLVENLGEMRDSGFLTGNWLCQLGPRAPRKRLTELSAAGIRATLDADPLVSAPTPALALCIATLTFMKLQS